MYLLSICKYIEKCMRFPSKFSLDSFSNHFTWSEIMTVVTARQALHGLLVYIKTYGKKIAWAQKSNYKE